MDESLVDSNGTPIKVGDIIECPEVPFPEHACRWHACFLNGYNETPEIRDLGHNNIGMWTCHGPCFNRGPYWRHLDILSDDDLSYYFHTTRELAERIAAMEREFEELRYRLAGLEK